MQWGYLAAALRLVGVIHSATGNNTGNRGGRLCGIVHSDAMRPAAQFGQTAPFLRYVRHRTDPLFFFDYISIRALIRCAAKPI